MHKTLQNLLAKRGIEKFEDLNAEEQETYKNWDNILHKEELSMSDIKHFCATQCDIIKQKWADYNIEDKRKTELIAYFTVYNTLLTAIDSPKIAREALIKQLTELTN